MNWIEICFWFFAILIISSAIVVVSSRNIIYSVFALLFTFFGVAGIYVILSADFLAITQIMIYIGGILVLLIFGVMLTNRITGVDIKSGQTGKVQIVFAGFISVVVIGLLIYLFATTKWNVGTTHKEISNSINVIGNTMLTNYLLAFESASVLLLVAIIGAALIARRK
jgi:NADH-quinone oxidoreductase subunit J